MNYSDFIIFADESGDHGLVNINPEFPVFALAFCVVRVDEYINSIVPDMQRFKFSTWGHDSVVLHEREIRKSETDFSSFRSDPLRRERFMADLNASMEKSRMNVIASVIDKKLLVGESDISNNPYEIALLFCMEFLVEHLLGKGQLGKIVHVIFESRGEREDSDLELEFIRICANQGSWSRGNIDFGQIEFKPVFVSKATNSIGLQLADLVARPIALSIL